MQWVSGTAYANTSTPFYLPIPFPNACLKAYATSDGSNGNNVSILNTSKTAVTLYNVAGQHTPNVLAIGY